MNLVGSQPSFTQCRRQKDAGDSDSAKVLDVGTRPDAPAGVDICVRYGVPHSYDVNEAGPLAAPYAAELQHNQRSNACLPRSQGQLLDGLTGHRRAGWADKPAIPQVNTENHRIRTQRSAHLIERRVVRQRLETDNHSARPGIEHGLGGICRPDSSVHPQAAALVGEPRQSRSVGWLTRDCVEISHVDVVEAAHVAIEARKRDSVPSNVCASRPLDGLILTPNPTTGVYRTASSQIDHANYAHESLAWK